MSQSGLVLAVVALVGTIAVVLVALLVASSMLKRRTGSTGSRNTGLLADQGGPGGVVQSILVGRQQRPGSRGSAARRAGVVTLAGSRGWWVVEGPQAARRTFDPRLQAERARPNLCDLVVDGRAEGFSAESWSVSVRNLGSPIGLAARQHVLRLPCPPTWQFLVRSMPSRHELRYFPQAFKHRAGIVRANGHMMVGGDFPQVQERLGPFLDAIAQSKTWVVGLGDEVVLMSGDEPDAAELERRLGLGRAIAGALA